MQEQKFTDSNGLGQRVKMATTPIHGKKLFLQKDLVCSIGDVGLPSLFK